MMNSMLTTVDNPYDPFTQFDLWFGFDLYKGYNTCGVLARLTITSDELPDEDQESAIEDAIDEIVKLNPNGLFKKVTKS